MRTQTVLAVIEKNISMYHFLDNLVTFSLFSFCSLFYSSVRILFFSKVEVRHENILYLDFRRSIKRTRKCNSMDDVSAGWKLNERIAANNELVAQLSKSTVKISSCISMQDTQYQSLTDLYIHTIQKRKFNIEHFSIFLDLF